MSQYTVKIKNWNLKPIAYDIYITILWIWWFRSMSESYLESFSGITDYLVQNRCFLPKISLLLELWLAITQPISVIRRSDKAENIPNIINFHIMNINHTSLHNWESLNFFTWKIAKMSSYDDTMSSYDDTDGDTIVPLQF